MLKIANRLTIRPNCSLVTWKESVARVGGRGRGLQRFRGVRAVIPGHRERSSSIPVATGQPSFEGVPRAIMIMATVVESPNPVLTPYVSSGSSDIVCV